MINTKVHQNDNTCKGVSSKNVTYSNELCNSFTEELKSQDKPTENASSLLVNLTPYKYNGGQLYQQDIHVVKMLITVDWFECSTLGVFLDPKEPKDIICCSDEVYLVKDEKRANGTKHFENFYLVYLHGELFGSIRTTPRSPVLDPNLSIFKIENHILYQRGWIVRFDYVIEQVGIKVYNVSRLDVAIDGAGFMADYQNVISGKYKKVGRAKMSTIHEPCGKVEGFYIGSRSSPKFIRCYDKTKELRDNLGKNYITQWWDDNDFFVGDKVERIELTIKNKGLKFIKDFNYADLEKPNYLAGIMEAIFKNFYQFKSVEDKDSNVSRIKKIDAIEWTYFNALDVDKLPKTNKPNVIWALQQTISFLMRESYAGLEVRGENLWDTAYEKCFDYAIKYGILDWFKSKLPKWEKEKKYHNQMRAEVAYARKSRLRKDLKHINR